MDQLRVHEDKPLGCCEIEAEIPTDYAKQAVIDDTYDAHGTYEELILFTEAIKSWCHEAHIPTVEEYTSVGLVTTGALLITSTSYLGMCEDTATNKQVLDWLFSKPQILIASAITSRLNNDIRSHKFEQMRGHVASSVECYMKEHGVEEEEEAYKVLREEIENAWKDINQEFVRPANAVAKPLLERILNLSRVNEVTYRDGDGYTFAHNLKHHITLLLAHSIPITLHEHVHVP
ncbi:hypothetical protein FNV43_RR03990 [Rhamnella rubrinervis]|uniref:Terpene synthase metal-binding domain-containing protein n=1 Tax=Rhamnella rubrinervis TaxID=2594499 RepID=A0A8K0HJH7_9ROSA|nr:hypothetical protein FNV43_RR03990 [Rhamnella rubrinervis]